MGGTINTGAFQSDMSNIFGAPIGIDRTISQRQGQAQLFGAPQSFLNESRVPYPQGYTGPRARLVSEGWADLTGVSSWEYYNAVRGSGFALPHELEQAMDRVTNSQTAIHTAQEQFINRYNPNINAFASGRDPNELSLQYGVANIYDTIHRNTLRLVGQGMSPELAYNQAYNEYSSATRPAIVERNEAWNNYYTLIHGQSRGGIYNEITDFARRQVGDGEFIGSYESERRPSASLNRTRFSSTIQNPFNTQNTQGGTFGGRPRKGAGVTLLNDDADNVGN